MINDNDCFNEGKLIFLPTASLSNIRTVNNARCDLMDVPGGGNVAGTINFQQVVIKINTFVTSCMPCRNHFNYLILI